MVANILSAVTATAGVVVISELAANYQLAAAAISTGLILAAITAINLKAWSNMAPRTQSLPPPAAEQDR